MNSSFIGELEQRAWFFDIVMGGEIMPLSFSETPGIMTKPKSEILKTN